MNAPPGCPVVRFDHHAAAFARDPWSVYADLRAARVAYSETYGGFYVLSRYSDVWDAARDDETFSSDREVVLPATGVGRLIPLNADPPDLQRYRSALFPYFTQRAAEAMAGDIRRFTAATIDAFIESGHCDLICDLAAPVPAMTTLELMGLAPEDWAVLAEPLHDLIAYPTEHPNHESARAGVWAIRERFAAEAAARAVAPRDDMVTHLLGLEADGTLSRDEVVDLLMMVTIGGFDTTMAAIGSALLYLERHPDERRRLAAEPALLPAAVDEFLRFEAPVQGFARTVTRDIEIGGCPIPAGETVFLLWGSANRDPEAFERPDDVLLDRRPNRHLTFGVGGHRCLGAHLARVEMRVVLAEALRRLGDYTIDAEGVRWPASVGILYGRAHIPATFTPAPQERDALPPPIAGNTAR
ncbi:MAG: cytochrome P450 [bacterium]|nr:cytochrome P450 [bacterium]